jgi:hypothetical protein
MSTAKKTAHTILSFYYSDKEKPVADLRSDAEVSATFNNITTLTFCRAVFDSEDEALISILFGEGRPLVEKHLSRIERLHGFWKGPDNGLIPMDASVTEKYSVYAPITKEIQGTRTTNTGLGTDKDGAPVETDAPVIEIVHGKAPVTRDIRSPQNVTIGIGNDESGDAGEQRDAAVSYTLGEKADITVTSKSALTMGFKKAVSLETEEDYDLKALGEIKAECEGKASVKAEGDVSITSGGKCYIGNSSMDMLQLMLDFVTEIKNLKTFGSPGMHTVDPSSIASLTVFEQEINSLLKGGA